jgi:hypothetical protein
LTQQIEGLGIVAGRAHPKILDSQAIQTLDARDNIGRRARNRESLQKIFGKAKLVDHPCILTGFHPMLRVIIALVKAAELSFQIFRNLLVRKSGT